MPTIEQRFTRVLPQGIQSFKRILDQGVLWNDEVYLWAATLAHEIFESYLMLEAGSYLQLVSESTLEMFDGFFLSLQGEPSDLQAVYVNHSKLSLELLRDFPDFSSRLEKRMRAETIEAPNLALRLPNLLKSRFARIMLLQLGMLEQPSIRVYTSAIRYLSREGWDRMMEGRLTPEATAQAGEVVDITPEGIYHGFFGLLGKFSAINEALGIVSTQEESADSAKLLEYARNAIDWRLDLRSHESARRFELLRKYVINDATEELSGYERTRLRQQLENVLNEVVGSVTV